MGIPNDLPERCSCVLTPARRSPARRPVAALLTVIVVVVGASCGREDPRPSVSAWRGTWETNRDAYPDAETLLAGGTEFCDQLVGTLRLTLPELRPAPTEALDDAVHAWINHAETIAFECPHDPAELDAALELLVILEAEIDAGLTADSTG